MRVVKKTWIFVLAAVLLLVCALPVSASEMKTLYFEETNGTMTWNADYSSDGNWFMSFTNMIPGEKYQDVLKIENGSNKTYRLYVRAIPVQQDEKQDQLLELISMKVSLDSKTIYKGSASGKQYENGNFQNVVYLGTYEPKEVKTIRVDLQLDSDIGMAFNDVQSKNDWEFMVSEVGSSSNSLRPIGTPQTMDLSSLQLYVMIAIVAMLCMIFFSRIRRKTKSCK